MRWQICTKVSVLSLPLSVAHAFRCCGFEYIQQLEFYLITILTRFVIFVLCFETGPFCCLWWVGLSFLFAPFSLLAVFYAASAFNSDVSNWNTGAVTTMAYSKCTLSLSSSLWPRHLPLWCGVEYKYDNSRFVGSQVSHVLFFLFL